MSYEQKPSRLDHLTSTTKDGKIELTEEQLSRVGGGSLALNFRKCPILSNLSIVDGEVAAVITAVNSRDARRRPRV